MTELEQELYDYLWEGVLRGEFEVRLGSVYSGPKHTRGNDTVISEFHSRFRQSSYKDDWYKPFDKVATDWDNAPLNKALS